MPIADYIKAGTIRLLRPTLRNSFYPAWALAPGR